MKNSFLICALMMVASGASAQLKVASNGKVLIGANTNLTPNSPLSVGGTGTTGYIATFDPIDHGVRINNNGGVSSRTGLVVANTLANNYQNTGILVSTSSGSSNQSLYGIRSNGGPTTAKSYGVAGGLDSGVSSGAAILGSVSSYPYIPATYTGVYAGFFYGNICVTGSTLSTVMTPSGTTSSNASGGTSLDTRSGESVTSKLAQLQARTFNRAAEEQLALEQVAASSDNQDVVATDLPKSGLSAIRYGLAADQLKAVFPELVYEDEQGNVSINYVEMVPLLVQSINELNARIAELEGGSKAKKSKKHADATAVDTPDVAVLSISQNVPNPFGESSAIEVSVPEDIQTAAVFFYDMTGKQVQKVDVTERGTSRINITAAEFPEGMYLYSLIADGKIVNTKKMIVTK